VQPAGDHAFAGAGFAFDQDGRQGAFEPALGRENDVELAANRGEAGAKEKGVRGAGGEPVSFRRVDDWSSEGALRSGGRADAVAIVIPRGVRR
jgi:hypothetical protein